MKILKRTFFLTSHKFESIAIMVKDPLDNTLPDIDREIVLEDPVSREQIAINPKLVRKIYEIKALERTDNVKRIFRKSNVDLLELTTSKSFALPLADFIKERVLTKGFFLAKW